VVESTRRRLQGGRGDDVAKAPTKADAEAALYEALGNVTVAARLLGLDPQALRSRIRKGSWADLAPVLADAREQALDVAEEKLMTAVRVGEPWAVQFYLKTQGQERGYGDRVEHAGVGRIEVVYVDS
jgi:hypothetical protein